MRWCGRFPYWPIELTAKGKSTRRRIARSLTPSCYRTDWSQMIHGGSRLAVFLAAFVVPIGHHSSAAAPKGRTSAGGERAIRVDGPTIVAFAPSDLARDAKRGSPGAAAALEHLEMGLARAEECLRKGKRRVRFQTVYGSQLFLERNGETRRVRLSKQRTKDIGAYLLEPGRKPCVIYLQAGQPSSLALVLPSAAGEYFGVVACVDEDVSGFCAR